MPGADGKPTTSERGYGADHRAARRRMEPLVKSGAARCVRCGGPIVDGKIPLRLKSGGVRLVSNWVPDHNASRTGYLGPAHYRCNARAAAQVGNRSPKRKRALRAGFRRPVTGAVFGPLK